MICPFCIGSGRRIGSTAPCPVCKGRGHLPDDRLDNPICAYCVGSGRRIGSTEICPVCNGWGRLPPKKVETPDERGPLVFLVEAGKPRAAHLQLESVFATILS